MKISSFVLLPLLSTARAFSSSTANCAMSATAQNYEQVVTKLREINSLEGISGLIGWDEMVMLPEESSNSRASQKTTLAGVIYEKRTDKELGELLKAFHEDPSSLSEVSKANIRESYKSYQKTLALPKELVKKMAQLETDGYNDWIKARKASDFALFKPVLSDWINTNIEKAKFIDATGNPYDTLLDEYEKGMTSKRIDEIFEEVSAGLRPLIAEIKEKGTPPDAAWLSGDYDTKAQAEMCEKIAVELGFDKKKGRLDVSVHPFTGGAHPTDVRMTTRFKKDDLTEGLTGAVHETGHSLYEQGRNLSDEWLDLPVSQALSMGVHESQSLLWERMVALSEPFMHYLLPRIQEAFPGSNFEGKTPADLYGAINTVRNPSFIRVEADEVTYTMHVILRYEIEKGLINGDITVDEVPALWNKKMAEYLGDDNVPPTDAQGCLQDVHWGGGAFGYFPTYSLGAMYACQIFNTAKEEIPNLEEKIKNGEFKPLREWLRTKVHESGSFHPTGDDLMVAVTGTKLDPQVFLKYLRDKYTEIYKL